MISTIYGSLVISMFLGVLVWEVVAQIVNQSIAFVTEKPHTKSTLSSQFMSRLVTKLCGFGFAGFGALYLYSFGSAITAIIYMIDDNPEQLGTFPMFLDGVLITYIIVYGLLHVARKIYRKNHQ